MAMTSLVPGILFPTTGLVYMHTPVDITTTTHDLRQKFRRASLNGKEWPADSPVSQVYDVKNTSSRLILLNNKLNEEQQKCHLRAHSAADGRRQSIQHSTPERHFRDHSPLPRRHVKCTDSSSPRYRRPRSEANQVMISQLAPTGSQMLPANREQKDMLPTEWHHYSCQGEATHPSHQSTRRSRARTAPPEGFRNAPHMYHPDLTLGQKRYLYEIARVYDMTRMKQLKQAQYVQLIAREQARGFFNPREYAKYLRYIGGPRKRQFGIQDPNIVTVVKNKEQQSKSSPDRQQMQSEWLNKDTGNGNKPTNPAVVSTLNDNAPKVSSSPR